MQYEIREAVDSAIILNHIKIREEAKIALFNALGPDHYATGEACLNLAEAYSENEDYEKAHPLFLEASRVISTNPAINEELFEDSQVELADSYLKIGSYQEALDLSFQLLSLFGEEIHPANQLFLLNVIAESYEELGDIEEELKIRKDIASLYEISFGDLSSEYLEEMLKVVALYDMCGKTKKALSEVNKLLKLYPYKEEPRIHIDILICKLICSKDNEELLDKTLSSLNKAISNFNPCTEDEELAKDLYQRIVPEIMETITNSIEEEDF